MIDAESGNHLWAERFDKPVADLFDMQDEIVARLANQLNAQLIAAEARRAQTALNPDSLDFTFRGWAAYNRGASLQNMNEARGFFERALALDPDNVEALVRLGIVFTSISGGGMTDDRAGALAAGKQPILKALQLAPDHASAHMVLGWNYVHGGQTDRAIAELEQALALDRNLAFALAGIGYAKCRSGRAEDTEGHVEAALRLSPRDVQRYIWCSVVGTAKLLLVRDDEAVTWLSRAIDANRKWSMPHFWLAAALVHLGRQEEAQEATKVGLALDPTFTVRRYLAASNDNPTHLAQRERIADGMRKAGVPEG